MTHLTHFANYLNSMAFSQRHMLSKYNIQLLGDDLVNGLSEVMKKIMYAPEGRYVARLYPQLHRRGSRAAQQVITKTPSIRGISYLRKFFPEAKIFIVLRDPRDVVSSEMKVFKREFRETVIDWRNDARRFIKFRENGGLDDGFKIIRYEDLYGDPHGQIKKALDFIGLDSAIYDFSAIDNAPVIGSSEDFAKGEWTWKPKPQNFNPLGKWKDWHEQRFSYFEQTAGQEVRKLGYRVFPEDHIEKL